MRKISYLLADVFNDKKFYKIMWKLALPIMIQFFLGSFLNMVDTVMVGKLGEAEIAAVGIANQYFFFYHMFLVGICMGCGIFIAQFWGKKDIAGIKRIMGVGLASGMLVSVVFMTVGLLDPSRIIALFNKDVTVLQLGGGYLRIVLLSYIFTSITFMYNTSLRSVGNAVLPMLISSIALISNVIFNYIFIFGKFGAPAMGVEGAALATLIARTIEVIALIATVYLSRSVVAASLRELTDISFAFVKKAYQTITPVILNDVSFGLASILYVAVYGRMGTHAVAAVQICNTINNIFMVVIFSMSSAAAVMIGNSIGAGEEAQSRDYARRFTILAMLVGVSLGSVLAAVSPLMLSAFNVSAKVAYASQIIMYIMAGIFIVRMVAIMFIMGILRGGGDARQAFYIEGFTMWFIGVPLTILGAFVFGFPIYIVYALAMFEELAKCSLSALRFKSGRWINNVTHNMTAQG